MNHKSKRHDHASAYGAAYQIIAALAGEAGLFDDPAVQEALDYFHAASEGDVKDIKKILPFHLRANLGGELVEAMGEAVAYTSGDHGKTITHEIRVSVDGCQDDPEAKG